MANGVAINSILNPETNSLSPSEKSKGGRFVSERMTKAQNRKRIEWLRSLLVVVSLFKINFWKINKKIKTKNTITTS